jgi:predicted kinase
MTRYLIHLVCGSTGAGKTTYAKRLGEEVQAVLFSIDQWMTALFWLDSPSPIEASWSMERVSRCMDQIWTVALQVAARGTPCILDLGFTRLRERRRFTELARAAGFTVQLHVLDVPPEERWRRVQSRNTEKGETHQLQFAVTRDMFDFVESMWEPPDETEMAACNGILIRDVEIG